MVHYFYTKQCIIFNRTTTKFLIAINWQNFDVICYNGPKRSVLMSPRSILLVKKKWKLLFVARWICYTYLTRTLKLFDSIFEHTTLYTTRSMDPDGRTPWFHIAPIRTGLEPQVTLIRLYKRAVLFFVENEHQFVYSFICWPLTDETPVDKTPGTIIRLKCFHFNLILPCL